MAQLPSQSQFGDYGEWPGRDVLDSGGERLGGVREIYLDRETGRPEWVLVDLDGDEARFVPLADASVESSTIRVAHTADSIRSAPGIGAEPRIDQTEERRLYEHYGIGYSEDESGSGLPAEEPEPGPEATTERTEAVAPSSNGDDTPTGSWSDAAGEPEPSNVAPPPAVPPSTDELDAADIKAPPSASEDFAATTEPTPEPTFETTSTPSGGGPIDEPVISAPAEATAPTAGGEILGAGAADPEADLTTSLGPDTVRVFTPPEPSTTSTPPSSAPADSGVVSTVKSRKGAIAAGVGVAAALLLLVRKLR